MTKDRLLWLVLIALGIGLVVLVVQLAVRDPGAISEEGGGPSLVHSVALLAILAASAVLHGRLKPGRVLTRLSIWLAPGAVLVLGYSFRHDAADMNCSLLGMSFLSLLSSFKVTNGVLTLRPYDPSPVLRRRIGRYWPQRR